MSLSTLLSGSIWRRRSAKKNEHEYYSFIHLLVETLNQYFDKVCELDIILNLEKTHYIVQEMVQNGQILETNKEQIISLLREFDNKKDQIL